MKDKLSIAISEEIGGAHYALLNFETLKKSASPKAQIDALNNDRVWQQDHQNDMSRRIDQLIEQIRSVHQFYD